MPDVSDNVGEQHVLVKEFDLTNNNDQFGNSGLDPLLLSAQVTFSLTPKVLYVINE